MQINRRAPASPRRDLLGAACAGGRRAPRPLKDRSSRIFGVRPCRLPSTRTGSQLINRTSCCFRWGRWPRRRSRRHCSSAASTAFTVTACGYEDEAGRLSQLFKAQPDLPLAARELKLLAKHTTLNMLVRWYRSNQVPFDRKLKVVTLTRDPVDWFISHFVQRFGHDARPLVEWHRHVTGDGLDRDGQGQPRRKCFGKQGRLLSRCGHGRRGVGQEKGNGARHDARIHLSRNSAERSNLHSGRKLVRTAIHATFA